LPHRKLALRLSCRGRLQGRRSSETRTATPVSLSRWLAPAHFGTEKAMPLAPPLKAALPQGFFHFPQYLHEVEVICPL